MMNKWNHMTGCFSCSCQKIGEESNKWCFFFLAAKKKPKENGQGQNEMAKIRLMPGLNGKGVQNKEKQRWKMELYLESSITSGYVVVIVLLHILFTDFVNHCCQCVLPKQYSFFKLSAFASSPSSFALAIGVQSICTAAPYIPPHSLHENLHNLSVFFLYLSHTHTSLTFSTDIAENSWKTILFCYCTNPLPPPPSDQSLECFINTHNMKICSYSRHSARV